MFKEIKKPEFRKDLVSGDWILVASTSRSNRPGLIKKETLGEKKKSIKDCPFEDPQKSGNPHPLLWYPHPKAHSSEAEDLKNWFVQVIPNKYPLFFHQKTCPEIIKKGYRRALPAVGYHEVIITRDHKKSIGEMTVDEVQLILKTYKERYRLLSRDPCVKYILIFHNHGKTAGASLEHPHSQLAALPIIDPDVWRSTSGSQKYYEKHKKCVHCTMIEQEVKDKVRIVEKNKHFVTLTPYASKVSYETRIYPLEHSSRFEELHKEKFPYLAKALKNAIYGLNKALKNPDYNFFIHTAPVEKSGYNHYHWHIEILPRGFNWAGLELGSGIEVVAVSPENATQHLREQK